MLALPEKDPIADVVELLRPHAVRAGAVRASGPWALRFRFESHVKFGTVIHGGGWLAVSGSEPVRLAQGDAYLLGNPKEYVLCSAPTELPRAVAPRLAEAVDGVLQVGYPAEDDTLISGGWLKFDDRNASLLLDALPTLVHVPAAEARERVGPLIQLLLAELRTADAGGALVRDRLAQVALVHMLRLHARHSQPAGWLGALGDARLGAALRALHAEVARRWTVEELAHLAGMSRSAFAAAFKAQVGSAPLEYLTEWRMSIARDALRHDRKTISELAYEIGYESESSFSTAFRRIVGHSPKQFREAARASVQ